MNVVTVGLSEKIQCTVRVMKFKIYCKNPKSKFPKTPEPLLMEASTCTIQTSLYYGQFVWPERDQNSFKLCRYNKDTSMTLGFVLLRADYTGI